MKAIRLCLRMLGYATGIVLLMSLAWHLWYHPAEIRRLAEISLPTLASVLIAQLAAYIIQVGTTWWLTRIFIPALGLWEYFLVSSSGFVIGMYGLPGTSYAVKTIYCKQRYGFSHIGFLAINIVIGLLALFTAGTVACGALTLIGFGGNPVHIGLWLLAIGLTLGAIIVLVMVDKVLPLVHFEKTARFTEFYRQIIQDHVGLRLVLISLTFRSVFSFFGFGLLFYALGGGSLLAGGTIDALSTLLRLVRITPGNLGIYEWSVASLGQWLDASLATGLIAAGLYRLIGLLVVTSTALVGQLIARIIGFTPVNDSSNLQ